MGKGKVLKEKKPFEYGPEDLGLNPGWGLFFLPIDLIHQN